MMARGDKLLYLIIHCTATPAGREVTSDEIRHWHTAPVEAGGRGWKQVGYADMIHLDGSLENLVPYNENNIVEPWEVTNGAAGYNGCARHVVLVGGCDANGIPEATFTADQYQTLAEYVVDFKQQHPDARIIGHNEIAPKACPCFDVQEFLSNYGVI